MNRAFELQPFARKKGKVFESRAAMKIKKENNSNNGKKDFRKRFQTRTVLAGSLAIEGPQL